MKFRDDIEIDSTWVVSDTHFGHDNIVGFCHRPMDHEQVMIAEWRKEVPDEATVLHLGDLCYKSNARFKNIIAPELTGSRKLLIAGNHDRQRFSFYRDCGFKLTRPFSIEFDYADLELEIPWVVSFSHYPYGPDDHPGGPYEANARWMPWNWLWLHGHIHNNGYSRDAYVPFLRNHINLSVEQTKYKPVNLGTLLRAVLLGDYPETTEAQLEEARERKNENRDT